MYRELEIMSDPLEVEGAGAPAPCDCVCGEPAPADGDEVPAGNRTVVNIEVYYDING